ALNRRPAWGQHPMQMGRIDTLHTLRDRVEPVAGPGDRLGGTSRRRSEERHPHDGYRDQSDETPLHVLPLLFRTMLRGAGLYQELPRFQKLESKILTHEAILEPPYGELGTPALASKGHHA